MKGTQLLTLGIFLLLMIAVVYFAKTYYPLYKEPFQTTASYALLKTITDTQFIIGDWAAGADGRVRLQQYYQPSTFVERRRFEAVSLARNSSYTLYQLVIKDGLLNVDTPNYSVFPECYPSDPMREAYMNASNWLKEKAFPYTNNSMIWSRMRNPQAWDELYEARKLFRIAQMLYSTSTPTLTQWKTDANYQILNLLGGGDLANRNRTFNLPSNQTYSQLVSGVEIESRGSTFPRMGPLMPPLTNPTIPGTGPVSQDKYTRVERFLYDKLYFQSSFESTAYDQTVLQWLNENIFYNKISIIDAINSLKQLQADAYYNGARADITPTLYSRDDKSVSFSFTTNWDIDSQNFSDFMWEFFGVNIANKPLGRYSQIGLFERRGIQPSSSVLNRAAVRNHKEKLIRFFIANESKFMAWHNSFWSQFESQYATEEAALRAYYESTEPAALAAERQRLLTTSAGIFTRQMCKDILPNGREKWQELFEISEKNIDLIQTAISTTSTDEQRIQASTILSSIESARAGATSAVRVEGFQTTANTDLATDLQERYSVLYTAFSKFTITIPAVSNIPFIYIGRTADQATSEMRDSAKLCSRFRLTRSACAENYFRVTQISADTYKAFIINDGKTKAEALEKCTQPPADSCQQDLSQAIIDTNPDANVENKQFRTFLNPSKTNNTGVCDEELTTTSLLLIPNAARNYIVNWIFNRTKRLVEYYYKDSDANTIDTKKGAVRALTPTTTLNFTRKVNLNALAQFFYESLNGMYAMTYIYDMSTVGNSVVDIRFDVTVHGDPIAIYNRIEELTRKYTKFTQSNLSSTIRDEARARYIEKLYELQDEQDRNIQRVFKGLIGRFFYENVGGMPNIVGFTLEPSVITSYIPEKNGGISLPMKDLPGNISYAPITIYTKNISDPIDCRNLDQIRLLLDNYKDAIFNEDMSARIEKGEPAKGQFLQSSAGLTFWAPADDTVKYAVNGAVTCDGINVATEAKAATDAELTARQTQALPFTCAMLYKQGTGWDLSGQLVLKSIQASQQISPSQCAVKWTETILDPGLNEVVESKALVTRRALITYKPNSDFWMANNRVIDISGFAFLPSDTGEECKFDATQYKNSAAYAAAYRATGFANNASLCRSVAPDVKYSPFVYRELNTGATQRVGFAVPALNQDFRTNLEQARLAKAWNLALNPLTYTYPTNIPYEATLTTREGRCPPRSCSDTEVLYSIADEVNTRDVADFKILKVMKAVTANSQQCDLEMQVKESGKDNIIFGLSDDANKIWFLSPSDKKKYELRVAESTGTDGSVNFCFDKLKITNTASAGQPPRLSFSHTSRMAQPGNFQLDRDFTTSPDPFRCTQLYDINQVQRADIQGQVTISYSNVIFVRNDEGTQYFILGLGGGAKYSLGPGPNFGYSGVLSTTVGTHPTYGYLIWNSITGYANTLRVEGGVMRIWTNQSSPTATTTTFPIFVPGNRLLNTLPTSSLFAIIPTTSIIYYSITGDKHRLQGYTSESFYPGASSAPWSSLQTNLSYTFQNELFALDGSTLYFVGAGDGKKYTVQIPALNSQGISDICYDTVKFTNKAAAGQPMSLQFSHSLFRSASWSGLNNLATLQTADTPFTCSQMFTSNPIEKPLQGASFSRILTQRRAVTIAVDPETCDISIDKIYNDGTAKFIQETTQNLPVPFEYTTTAVKEMVNVDESKTAIAATNQAVHAAVGPAIARYGTETERLKTIIIGEAAGVTTVRMRPDLLRSPLRSVKFTFREARNSNKVGISSVFLYKNEALIDLYNASIRIDGKPDMNIKALSLKPANYMARTSFTPETVVSFPTPWSVVVTLERPTLVDSFSFSTGNDTNEDPIDWFVEGTFPIATLVETFQNVQEATSDWIMIQDKRLPTSQSILQQATLPPLTSLATLDTITDVNKIRVEMAYATLTQKFAAYKATPTPTLEAEISALLTTINQNAYPSRGYYIAPRQSLLPNVAPQIQQQSPLRPKSAAECESFAWHPETIKRISEDIYNTMNTALFTYIGRSYLGRLTQYAIDSDTYTFYMKTQLTKVGMNKAIQTAAGPTYALQFQQGALCDYKPIVSSFRKTTDPINTGVRYIRVKPVYGDEYFSLGKSSRTFAYEFTRAEAAAAAQQIGVRLASSQEARAELKTQMNICAWSWTSDNIIAFPNYEPQHWWCWPKQNTLATWNTGVDTRYNALVYGRKPRTSSFFPGLFYFQPVDRLKDGDIELVNGQPVRDTTKFNYALWSKWQLRLSQIAVLSSLSGQNIALGKTVTASSIHTPDNGAGVTRPCLPSRVVDGTYTPRSFKDGFVTDMNTLPKWEANEAEYIEVDLGSEQAINKVVVFAPEGMAYLQYTVEAYDANRNLIMTLNPESVTGLNKVYSLDTGSRLPPDSAYINYPALRDEIYRHPTDPDVIPGQMDLQLIQQCIARNQFRVNTFAAIEKLAKLFYTEYSKRIPGYIANPIPKLKTRAFLSGIHGYFIDALTNSIVIQPKYFYVGADLSVTSYDQASQTPMYMKLYYDPVPFCPPQSIDSISKPGVEQFRFVRLSGFESTENTIEIGKMNFMIDDTNIRAKQGIFFSGYTLLNTNGSTRPSSSSSAPTVTSRFTTQLTEFVKAPYGLLENTRWFGHYNETGPGQTLESCQQLCDGDTEFGGGINMDGTFSVSKGNYQCDQVLMHPTLSWAQGKCWFYGPGYATGATGDAPAPSTDNAGWLMYVYPRRLRLYRKDTTLYIIDPFNNRILKTPITGAPAISNLVYGVTQPRAVTILPNGLSLFCTPNDTNYKIQRVQASSADYSPTANPIQAPQYTLAGTSTRISFVNPLAIATNTLGTRIAITDFAAGRVYVGNSADATLTRHTLQKAALVQIDSTNTVYVTAQGDSGENWGTVVQKLVGSTFTPFVGSTVGTGTATDDGTGTAAKFMGILDMVFDEANTLYIAEDITDYTVRAPVRQYKGRVRSVTPSGIVTTLIPALPFRPESIAVYRSGMTLSVFLTSAFLRSVYKADIPLSAADPSMLFNPDPTTFWSETVDNLQSLTVDLGGLVAANQLNLSTAPNFNRFPKRFTVQVSPDGNSWRTVYITPNDITVTAAESRTFPFTLKVPEYDAQFQPFPSGVTGKPPTSPMPYGWGGFSIPTDLYIELPNTTLQSSTFATPTDYYDPVDGERISFAAANPGLNAQKEVANLSMTGAILSIERTISQDPPTLFSVASGATPVTRFYALGDTSNRIIAQPGTSLFIKDLTYRPPVATRYLFNSIRFTGLRTRDPNSPTYTFGKLGLYWSNSDVIPVQVTSIRKLNNAAFNTAIQAKQQQITAAAGLPSTPANLATLAGLRSELDSLLQQQAAGIAGTAKELAAAQALFTYTNEDQLTLNKSDAPDGFILEFAMPVFAYGFTFSTGTNNFTADPVQWQLDIKMPNRSWRTVERMTTPYAVPQERGVQLPIFDFRGDIQIPSSLTDPLKKKPISQALLTNQAFIEAIQNRLLQYRGLIAAQVTASPFTNPCNITELSIDEFSNKIFITTDNAITQVQTQYVFNFPAVYGDILQRIISGTLGPGLIEETITTDPQPFTGPTTISLGTGGTSYPFMRIRFFGAEDNGSEVQLHKIFLLNNTSTQTLTNTNFYVRSGNTIVQNTTNIPNMFSSTLAIETTPFIRPSATSRAVGSIFIQCNSTVGIPITAIAFMTGANDAKRPRSVQIQVSRTGIVWETCYTNMNLGLGAWPFSIDTQGTNTIRQYEFKNSTFTPFTIPSVSPNSTNFYVGINTFMKTTHSRVFVPQAFSWRALPYTNMILYGFQSRSGEYVYQYTNGTTNGTPTLIPNHRHPFLNFGTAYTTTNVRSIKNFPITTFTDNTVPPAALVTLCQTEWAKTIPQPLSVLGAVSDDTTNTIYFMVDTAQAPSAKGFVGFIFDPVLWTSPTFAQFNSATQPPIAFMNTYDTPPVPISLFPVINGFSSIRFTPVRSSGSSQVQISKLDLWYANDQQVPASQTSPPLSTPLTLALNTPQVFTMIPNDVVYSSANRGEKINAGSTPIFVNTGGFTTTTPSQAATALPTPTVNYLLDSFTLPTLPGNANKRMRCTVTTRVDFPLRADMRQFGTLLLNSFYDTVATKSVDFTLSVGGATTVFRTYTPENIGLSGFNPSREAQINAERAIHNTYTQPYTFEVNVASGQTVSINAIRRTTGTGVFDYNRFSVKSIGITLSYTIFDTPSTPSFSAYSLTTNPTDTTQDPISWRVEGSRDNTTWSLIHRVTNQAMPTERNCDLPKYFFPMFAVRNPEPRSPCFYLPTTTFSSCGLTCVSNPYFGMITTDLGATTRNTTGTNVAFPIDFGTAQKPTNPANIYGVAFDPANQQCIYDYYPTSQPAQRKRATYKFNTTNLQCTGATISALDPTGKDLTKLFTFTKQADTDAPEVGQPGTNGFITQAVELGTTELFTSIRFVPLKTSNTAVSNIRISKLIFLTSTGAVYTFPAGTTVTSPTSPSNTSVQNVYYTGTESLSTEWTDTALGTIQYTIPAPGISLSTINSFSIVVGSVPSQAPIQWRLEASSDQILWKRLHLQSTDLPAPTQVQQSYPRFYFDTSINSQVNSRKITEPAINRTCASSDILMIVSKALLNQLTPRYFNPTLYSYIEAKNTCVYKQQDNSFIRAVLFTDLLGRTSVSTANPLITLPTSLPNPTIAISQLTTVDSLNPQEPALLEVIRAGYGTTHPLILTDFSKDTVTNSMIYQFDRKFCPESFKLTPYLQVTLPIKAGTPYTPDDIRRDGAFAAKIYLRSTEQTAANIAAPTFIPLPYSASRFVRIFFTKLRADQSEVMAIDSFQFFAATMAGTDLTYTQVTPLSAQNPGGSADMSKSPIIDTQRQTFLFEFAANSYPNGFSFKTYSESPGTDPLQWIVQTSQDGMTWYKAYEQNEDAPILETRLCQQPIYLFNYANLGTSYALDGCSESQKTLGTCSKTCADPGVIATMNAKFREVNQISDAGSYKILGYGDDSGNNKCTMAYITPGTSNKQTLSVGNEVTFLQEQRATFTVNPTTALCRNVTYNMTQDDTPNTVVTYGPRTLATASKACDSTDVLQMVARMLNTVFIPLSYDFNATTNTCVYKLQDDKVLSVSFFTSLMNELYIRSLRLSSPGTLPAPTPVTEGRVKSVDECVPAGVVGHEKAITSVMINALNAAYTAKYGTAYPLRIKKYGYDEANKRCIYDLWENGLPPELLQFSRIALAVEVKYNGDCTPSGTLLAPFRNLTLPTIEMTGLGSATKPYRYLMIDQLETRNPDAAAVKLGKLTFGTASGTTYTPHPELAASTIVQTGILQTSEILMQLPSTDLSSKVLVRPAWTSGNPSTFTQGIPSTEIRVYLKANLDQKYITRDYSTVVFMIRFYVLASNTSLRYYFDKTWTNPSTNPIDYSITADKVFTGGIAAGDYIQIALLRTVASGTTILSSTVKYPVSDIGVKIDFFGPTDIPNPNYWSVTNPQGSYTTTLQKSIALLDNTSPSTPYADPQKKAILIDTLQANKQLTAYSFTTTTEAGSSDADPIKWKLYASQDTFVWQLIDDRSSEQPVSLERGCNQRVWTIGSTATPFLRDSCADVPRSFRDCNKQCTDPDMLPVFLSRFYALKGLPATTPVEQSPLNIRKLGYSSSEAGGDQCVVEYDNAVTGAQGRMGFMILPTRKYCDEATTKPFNIQLNETSPPLDTALTAFPATANESYQYLRFRFTKLRGETATYSQISKLFLFTAAGRLQQTFPQGTTQVTRIQQGAVLFSSGEPTNTSVANLQDYDTYDSLWESTSGPGTVLVKLAAATNTLTGFTLVAGADPSRLPTQWVVEYFSTAQNVWKVIHMQATDIDRTPVAFQSYPVINFNGQVAASPIESYYFSSARNIVAATDANCTSAATAQAVIDAYASRQINIDFNPVAYRLDPNNTVIYKLVSGLIVAVDINVNTAGQTVVRSITHNPGAAEPATVFADTIVKPLGSIDKIISPEILNSFVRGDGDFTTTKLVGTYSPVPRNYMLNVYFKANLDPSWFRSFLSDGNDKRIFRLQFDILNSSGTVLYTKTKEWLNPATNPSSYSTVPDINLPFTFNTGDSIRVTAYRTIVFPSYISSSGTVLPLVADMGVKLEMAFNDTISVCIPSNPCLNASVLNTVRSAFTSTRLGIPGPAQSYFFSFIGYAFEPSTNMCIYELDPYTKPPALRTITTLGFIFDRSAATPCTYRIRGSPVRDPTRTVSLIKTIPYAADNTFKFNKLRFIPTKTRSGGSKVSVGKFSFFSRDAEAFTVNEGFQTVSCSPGFFNSNGVCAQAWGGVYQPRTGNISSSQLIRCPTGTFCPPGSSVPQKCPDGMFSGPGDNVNGRLGVGACEWCIPGQSRSPANNTVTITRADGTTTTMSAGHQSWECAGLCPQGFYCPRTSSVNIACPRGTWGNVQGLQTESQCRKCPNGQTTDTTGNTSQTACRNCEPGTFCVNGVQAQCPVNTYSSTIAATSQSTCLPCPTNSTCPPGSTSFTCNTGFYKDNLQCLPCPPNSQSCPSGTTSFSCNGGFYKNGAVCSPCPAGSFCPPGATTPTPCPPGVYCPPKSSAAGTATPQVAGPHTFTATSRDIQGTTATDLSGATTYNIANFYITADPNQPWTSDTLQPVMFNFPQPATLVGFSFTTSGRSADEDPVQWRIQGSVDGTYWFDIQVQATDFATSTTRSCDQPRFFFDFENTPNQDRDACASGPSGQVAGFQDYHREAHRQTRKQSSSPLKEGFGRLATPSISTLAAQFKPPLKQPLPPPPAGPVETQRSIETYEDKPTDAKPTQHKYLRFRPLKTRSPSHPVVQVASFSIETPAGPLPASKIRATNPMGTWKGDVTELVGGGATGWTDAHKSALIFAFREPLTLTGFRFVTGDEAAADPVRWKLEVSTNGTYWETLVDQSKSDFRVPTARGATVSIPL